MAEADLDLGAAGWRVRLAAFIEAPATGRFVMAVILLNAAVLGLETSPAAMAAAGPLLLALDAAALAIFVAELALKLAVYRLSFFKSPWNLFDFAVVAIALVPAGAGLTVLRALRVLRVLRLLTVVPKLRLVVQGLLAAVPAMSSVVTLLALFFYVFAVMATKLFGAGFEDWFGSVGASLYSLFQIMTLESWSMGIVRPVMEVYPHAWAFFVPFILVTSFAILNLFIAIVVNSMHEVAAAEVAAHEQSELSKLRQEIGHLRREIAALRGQPAGAD